MLSRAIRNLVGRRPAEITVLVALSLLGSIISFVAIVAPATMHHFVAKGIIFGCLFAVLALVTWFGGARLSEIELLVLSAGVVGTVSAVIAVANTPQGVSVVTFAYLWTTIYVAAYFSRRTLAVILVLIGIGSGAALIANRVHSGLGLWVLANATTTLTGLVLQSAQARLRREAETDLLTGLMNRRGFLKAAALERSVSERFGFSLYLAVIDLDDFKSVNDSAGHQAGDDMLVELTSLWRDQIKSGELLGRFGGDEFIVLIPCETESSAQTMLDKLRLAHALSWTAGLSRWEPTEPFEACLARADEDLYARKIARGIDTSRSIATQQRYEGFA